MRRLKKTAIQKRSRFRVKYIIKDKEEYIMI